MHIQIIGLGYIGLPSAAVIAKQGLKVTGVDINPEIVQNLNAGKIHIVEPDLEQLVQEVVQKGFLKAVQFPVEADVHIVVVPTPCNQDGKPDISLIETATLSLFPVLRPGDTFIIESTSPVKTTEKIAEFIFSKRTDLKGKLHIAYCPERVLPGNIIYELENNDRVIGGIDDVSTEKAMQFYSLFVKGRLHKTNSRTAELCKLTENSSRDVQIAFANEISMICDEAGINTWELIDLANKHPRVNILQPGCGVGGHCIAVDPWFIVSDYPKNSKLIHTARNVNAYKADWCFEKVITVISEHKKKCKHHPIIACMGLAFKPNIDDFRESPAKRIVTKLLKTIPEEYLLIVEPNISVLQEFPLTSYLEAYQRADIIVWLVRHKEFLDIVKNNNKTEIDFCGVRK